MPKCNICQRVFETPRGLAAHTAKQHKPLPREASEIVIGATVEIEGKEEVLLTMSIWDLVFGEYWNKLDKVAWGKEGVTAYVIIDGEKITYRRKPGDRHLERDGDQVTLVSWGEWGEECSNVDNRRLDNPQMEKKREGH